MLFSSVPEELLPPEKRARAAQLLSLALEHHFRFTAPQLDELERLGVFLGNGGFALAVVQEDSPVMQRESAELLVPALETACRAALRAPLYYCLTVGGTLHMLLCYPRMADTREARAEVSRQLGAEFTAIAKTLARRFPKVHVLVSEIFFGEKELFLAANSVHHAMEYYDFRTETPLLARPNAERQLHSAFVEDFHAYDKFVNQIVEQLTAEPGGADALANTVVEEILHNSSDSMESVHHHIQIFILTLTARLSDAGLVDADYIRRHEIVRRAMGFETEADLRACQAELLGDLQRQYFALTALDTQRRLRLVREYVLTHIADCALSVNQLAERFSLSPSRLTRQFRRYYGLSLHQFIQSVRLQRARELIFAHPDWTLQAIGEAAGYLDASTMYRAFQRADGVAPGALKAQARHRAAQNSTAKA